MDKSLSDRMRIAVIGTPLAEVKIWAKEVFTLESEIEALKLRLQGLVCETCGTNSWFPCDQGQLLAVWDDNDGWMRCGFCHLQVDNRNKRRPPTLAEYERTIETLAKYPGSPIPPHVGGVSIYPGDPGEGFKEVDPDAYRGGT